MGSSRVCLSVVELGGVGPFLLILLVVLHPLEPLPGEVLEHDVVVTGGEGTERHTDTQGEVWWGPGCSGGGGGGGRRVLKLCWQHWGAKRYGCKKGPAGGGL